MGERVIHATMTRPPGTEAANNFGECKDLPIEIRVLEGTSDPAVAAEMAEIARRDPFHLTDEESGRYVVSDQR